MSHTESPRHALVLDDEPGMVAVLEHLLKREGWHVVTASSLAEAQASLAQVVPDLAVVDVYLQGASGLEFVETLRHRSPETGILVISSEDTSSLAMKAIESGADYFASKPISPPAFLLSVRNVFRLREQRGQLQHLRDELAAAVDDRVSSGIVTQNDAMRGMLTLVKKVAGRDLAVLVTGESGTGKELIARAIHHNSPRRSGPFVEVNCAAIPENLVESELFGHEKGSFTGAVAARAGRLLQANRGTLFLDEIGEMPLPMQAKLLRALQEKKFEPVGANKSVQSDFRLVCATNRDLQGDVRSGHFREDLYYRVAVFALRLPALRERAEDIELLIDHFLRKQGDTIRFSPEALTLLRNYSWPGNVRELRNFAESLPVYCARGHAGEDDVRDCLGSRLPTTGTAGNGATPSDPTQVRKVEDLVRDEILRALRLYAGNTAQAARALGMGRSSLYRHIEKEQIDLNAFKGAPPAQA
jgi:two-component system nitrogen regulation response regulator NtrX